MGMGGFPRLVVLLLGISLASAYIIPSEDLEADVQIQNLDDPATIYFTYNVKVVLGNSVQFQVIGSTADGDKKITVEANKFVRQEVTKTTENGKPVIKLVILSTVRNVEKKIKYSGVTTITYKAHTQVQWYTDHHAVQELGYKGAGCDPDDVECQERSKPPPPPPPPKCIPTGELTVRCQETLLSPGVYRFDCIGVDPCLITVSTEHILWLNAAKGQNQNLDVTIPNYRVEELIRAGIKASSGGSTNINILLKKPDTIYDVQAQDGGPGVASKPSVSLQYEDVPKPISIHYPTDRQYSPLAGPIREP